MVPHRPHRRHDDARKSGTTPPRMIRRMLLALDIGNTNITIGLFRAGALLGDPARGHGPAGDARRGRAAARRAAPARRDRPRRHRRRSRWPRSCPPSTVAVEAVAERRERAAPRRRRPARVPLAVRVDRPGEVGADRLVNALAAARLYGTPAVVVDFGTATTLDCVAADGAYVGGAIAPGLELGPGGARSTDRQAAPDRAARPGPGDRAGHGQRDAVGHDLRLPGPRRRPARRGSGASWPTPTASRRPRSRRS